MSRFLRALAPAALAVTAFAATAATAFAAATAPTAAPTTTPAAATTATGPKTFVFDRAHTEIGFNIRHFFNKVHGRFNDYGGQFTYDPSNVSASTVEVTIADSSIYTANDRRDADLRSPNFFEVAKYPAITFKSTKVIPGKDENHFQVVGDLDMHGVKKPVTLDVEMLGMGPVAIGGRAMGVQAGFSASSTIKRQDWGITWNRTLDQGGVMLGDDVEIVISVAARTQDQPPPQAAAPATPPADKK
jgi:polyisoprenoid-binding protein YceI